MTLSSLKSIGQLVIDCELYLPENIENDLLIYQAFDNGIDNEVNNSIEATGENIEFGSSPGGLFGTSLSLNEDRFVRFENNPELKVDFPFSFNFWIFPFETGSGFNQIYTSDLSLDNPTGFNISLDPTSAQLRFFLLDGSFDEGSIRGVKSINPLSKFDYTNISIVANSAEDVDIYFNGCMEEVENFGNGPLNLNYSEADSYIGRSTLDVLPDNDYSYLYAFVDEFYFWNRPIDEKEIKYLYQNFNIPEITLESEYILTKNASFILLSLSEEFTKITWLDSIENSGLFITEPGEYYVETEYNCHRFCHEFTVTRDESSVASNTNLKFQICPGDSIEINGNFYSENWESSDTFNLAPNCDSIVNYEVIKLEFEFLEEVLWVEENETVGININSANISSISWFPLDGISCSDCLDPIFTPTEDQVYQATIITNEGCEIIEDIAVRITVADVFYIANIFSPNEDGINDIFNLQSKNLVVFNMQIYDRWGNQVFNAQDLRSDQYESGWDGNYKGQQAVSATYSYVIEILESEGNENDSFPYFLKAGTISLIR